MSDVSFPRTRVTSLAALSPSIHWAQEHRRSPDTLWDRRIYDFELLYLQQGEIELLLGGQTYRLSSGTLICIPPGVHHRVLIRTQPEALFLGIHYDYFDELFVSRDEDIIVNEANVRERDFCFVPVFPDPLSLKTFYRVPPTSLMISIMRQLIEEFTRKQAGYALTCKGMMLQLIGLLLRLSLEPDPRPAGKYTEQVLQIHQRMEDDCGQEWSTPRIAELLHVSDDYAIKLFKSAVGQPPHQALQAIRHHKAKQLLRETDWSLEAIARHVGYDDMHYFSRLFHKCEGMTARDYRKLSGIL